MSQNSTGCFHETAFRHRLDKPLLVACEADAKRLCESAVKEVTLNKDTRPVGAVISCLYHHLFMEDDKRVCSPDDVIYGV